MGIPKFYRWTSERYPCLSERIKEYQIPEFDNLYLDMNGIIHNCSHPNDEDIHLRIPEQQIFKDIFHYIDFLFKMIKPCKVFFMAVDGVAPRAKMNQQRGRRFKSARTAEDQEAEAIRKGEILPSEERFDSNCITPGTEFMARLHEQLKYFVKVKVSTDPLWQRAGLVIYLSGHDVPGEGEHKIMDFIRHERSKPDYVPVRHCLYGLDADLVMLGLSTHELQFSLLREEVKFSRPPRNKKGGRRPPKPATDARSYDLTNVSIFKADAPTSAPPSANAMSKSVSLPAVAQTGESFASILEKPTPAVGCFFEQERQVQEKNSNGSDEENLVPGAPDESGAKGVYRAPLPEKTTFLLLHLSLFRDYIDFEFKELKEDLKQHPTIQYDLEKIIDDWILMNILVGNDFVPHLPHLHIVRGALPMLYRIYSEILPTLDGYINENGFLNLKRFEVFLKKLSEFDIDTFRETYDDMKYMESKTGKNIVLGEKMFEGFDFGEGEIVEDELERTLSPELKALAQRTEAEVFGTAKEGPGLLCSDIFGNNDDTYFNSEDSPELRLEFQQHKRSYYINKLGIEEISPQFLETFCKEYIRAIQWVLLYYYKGVSSWGWFYPFHYAPFCSDLRKFGDFTIQFEKGQPFRPFEQLLAVLPAQSKKLLPPCYQWLMTDDHSPIVNFYPKQFEQDLNGKKQDWEAVVLIPFIDEGKLLEVMKNEESRLSVEEVHRNKRGALLLHSYVQEDTGQITSAGDLFPPMESSHVKVVLIEEVTYNDSLLPKGVHPKAPRDAIYQGFPSLKSKPVVANVEKAEIKVFEFVTREESMILNLEEVQDEPRDVQALARKLIGRSVWVNWPHLTFALVTGLLTRRGKFVQDLAGRIVPAFSGREIEDGRAEREFNVTAKELCHRHLKCKGIKLGNINVVIYAKMMEGRKVRCDSKGNVGFETLWSELQQPFALKSSMYEENITETFYLDRQLATTYVDLFKVGDNVFYLGDKNFGSMGTVIGHSQTTKTVSVAFRSAPDECEEANLSACVGHNALKSHEYYPSHRAAAKCQISSYVLSRITGTVYLSIEKETRAHMKMSKMLAKKAAAVHRLPTDASPDSSSSDDDFPALEMRKINVGLDLKFNKRNLEVRGYTSKRDGQWCYSDKAIQLVNEFVITFYDFIHFLERSEKGRDAFDAGEIFPNKPLDRVNEMVDWLDQKVRDLPRIPTNTNLLDDEDIDSIWKYILKHKNPSRRKSTKKWQVRPNLLLKPGLDRGCVPPIPNCPYEILDRVVCIDRGAPIPVGHRGTIVGIQTPQATEPEQIEESFKSTGAATLMSLIILCDPAPDVFDNPMDFGFKDKNKELTGALQSLLKISDGPSSSRQKVSKKSPAKIELEPRPSPSLRPRLVKLYPYQLLNLTEGPWAIHQGHRDSKQLQNLQGFPMNGQSKPKKAPPIKSQDGNKMNIGLPPRILPRGVPPDTPEITASAPPNMGPDTSKSLRKEFVPYESKKIVQKQASPRKNKPVLQENNTHSHPLMSMLTKSSSANNGNIVNVPAKSGSDSRLPWPPQPLKSARADAADQTFSIAAFLQQQFHAEPINTPSNPTVQPAPAKAVPQTSQTQTSQNNQKIEKVHVQKSQIFSEATAYRPQHHQYTPPRWPQPPAQAPQQGLDILGLLNKAADDYNASSMRHPFSQPNPGPTSSNQQSSGRKPPVLPLPVPPPSWTSSSMPQPQPPVQQHIGRSTSQRPPQHQQPVPLYHGFVPLQVARNSATSTSVGRNKRTQNPYAPRPQQQQPQKANTARNDGKSTSAGVHAVPPPLDSATIQNILQQSQSAVQRPKLAPAAIEQILQVQKLNSRLAANFGNN